MFGFISDFSYQLFFERIDISSKHSSSMRSLGFRSNGMPSNPFLLVLAVPSLSAIFRWIFNTGGSGGGLRMGIVWEKKDNGTNVVPWKGTRKVVSSQGLSSKHHFWGDMLVFGGVHGVNFSAQKNAVSRIWENDICKWLGGLLGTVSPAWHNFPSKNKAP